MNTTENTLDASPSARSIFLNKLKEKGGISKAPGGFFYRIRAQVEGGFSVYRAAPLPHFSFSEALGIAQPNVKFISVSRNHASITEAQEAAANHAFSFMLK